MSNKKKVIVIKQETSLEQDIRNLLPKSKYCVELLEGKDIERTVWLDNQPSVAVMVEVREQNPEDLRLIGKVRASKPHLPIIAVSSSMASQLVVKTVQVGASDFLTRPLGIDELQIRLEKALDKGPFPPAYAIDLRHESENRYIIVFGPNQKMQEIRTLIDKVADTDVPVLITGETGTGKELVARALHSKSARRDKPFVKVNTAALPVELLESELFGFEKGAFTGAYKKNPGKFELANNGVILLDEIGELDPLLQAKLLHVLQDGQFARVGGEENLNVDARVITTTNRELEKEVECGTFRKDLYYRLNVVNIHLPPLRERKDDIPSLVKFFHEKYCLKYNKKVAKLSAVAEEFVMEYHWPGNIRELENLIKKIVAYENEKIPLLELKRKYKHGGSEPANDEEQKKNTSSLLKEVGKRAAQEAERKLIMEVLQRNHWNRKRTAEILQISYRALLYKIKLSGLDLNI
jgi:DNA-binding NtrC family response regulator